MDLYCIDPCTNCYKIPVSNKNTHEPNISKGNNRYRIGICMGHRYMRAPFYMGLHRFS